MEKRIFDFFVSLIGLVILSPLLLIIALLIKLDSKGPVFFCQQRVGFKGKNFYIYKFRTMSEEAGENQEEVFAVGEDKRVTRIGRFLRNWKFDEFPQLINVLIGEMGIVGPRPELPKYVDNYSEKEKTKIFSVRPGITSLASMEYRQEENILAKSSQPEEDYIHKIRPEKNSLDLEYVEKQSFHFDLLIILETIKKVVFK